ncbi:molecular chaperone DnaK [Pseudomonas sp. 1-7]|nr:molecular chaperone DnaK [Pseudomonas sp. 1-7]
MTLTATTEAELLAQPADDYMNDAQQQFFRELLLTQRAELQARIDEEFTELRQPEISSDVADIGAAEEQRQWQLRLLEREKKLLDKIDQALERLARIRLVPRVCPQFRRGHDETGGRPSIGEPIGLKRLLLRPTATLCIEAKERQEQRKKHQRDRD